VPVTQHVEKHFTASATVRDVVIGMDASFPRSRAMALLLASDFPNKHRDYELVLQNEKESPEIRYLAAIYLGKIPTPAAMEILLKNSHIRDERVLAGSFADGEILELGRARAANGNAQFIRGLHGPRFVFRRRHLRERNLDAV